MSTGRVRSRLGLCLLCHFSGTNNATRNGKNFFGFPSSLGRLFSDRADQETRRGVGKNIEHVFASRRKCEKMLNLRCTIMSSLSETFALKNCSAEQSHLKLNAYS